MKFSIEQLKYLRDYKKRLNGEDFDKLDNNKRIHHLCQQYVIKILLEVNDLEPDKVIPYTSSVTEYKITTDGEPDLNEFGRPNNWKLNRK